MDKLIFIVFLDSIKELFKFRLSKSLKKIKIENDHRKKKKIFFPFFRLEKKNFCLIDWSKRSNNFEKKIQGHKTDEF